MAQEIINYGAAANDGTGDPLRTAFIKTDNNFDQIWAAGPVGSNITVINNTVGVTNTNGNLILMPNGVGAIQTNSRVVPSLTNTYDLGAANLTYRSAHIGSGGLSVAGNVSISGNLSAANVSFSGPVVFPSDVTIEGNLTVNGDTVTVNVSNLAIEDKTIVIANGSPNAASADNAGIIVDGADARITYKSGSDSWDFNKFLRAENGVFIGNSFTNKWNFGLQTTGGFLSFPSGASWRSDIETLDEYITSAVDGYLNFTSIDSTNNLAAELNLQHGEVVIRIHNGFVRQWVFFEDGTTFFPGNLIPDVDVSYSLGNATNQWSDLWVSNATIYMNNVPVTLSAGNVLTVAGQPVLSNNSNTSITTTGTITAGNVITSSIRSEDSTEVTVEDGLTVTGDIESHGNITANYFIGDGSLLTGISSTGNITFTDTTISAPDTSPIVIQAVDTGSSIEAQISLDPDAGDLTIRGTNMNVVIDSTTNNVEITAGNDVNIEATDDLRLTGNDIVSLRNLSTTEPVSIITDYDNTVKTWEFGVDGTLTAPGDIVVAGDVTGTSGASTLVLRAQPASNTFIQLNNTVDSAIRTVANLAISTANTDYTWTFDVDGNLTAPGNILATNGEFTTAVTARNLNADGGNISLNPDFGLIFTQANAVVTANTQSWNFDTAGNLTLPADGFLRVTSGIVGTGASPAPSLSGFSTLSAVTTNISGNVTGGNLISNNSVYANVDLIVGDRANASASKGRFVSNSGFMYLQIGNGTAGSTGNIVFSPYQSSTARVTVDTASGNITAVGNVLAGNISAGGNITGNTAGYAIGYRDIPQISFTGNATVVTADAGKHFYSTESTNYVLTIANNASQGFQVGAAITVVNQGTGTITIEQGSGVTLYMAGNATPGNRTLSTFGMATIMKVAADTWFVNGTGVA
jgi:hypothetical protein